MRILRILEYTYPDYDSAEEDMAKWGIPPTGSKEYGGKTIRSAVILAKDLNLGGEALEQRG